MKPAQCGLIVITDTVIKTGTFITVWGIRENARHFLCSAMLADIYIQTPQTWTEAENKWDE